jgi:hypothetical protein
LLGVPWEVEFTDEFQDWWDALSEEQQDDLAATVRLLIEFGPALGFPHSSKINRSRKCASYERRAAGNRFERCTHLIHVARRSF